MQQDKKGRASESGKSEKRILCSRCRHFCSADREETALSYVKGQVDFGRGIRYIGIESEDGETDTDIGPEKKRQLRDRYMKPACSILEVNTAVLHS